MPNYYYDGSFDGLLTVIFKAYKNRKEVIRVVAETEQLTFRTEDIHVLTDHYEARGVEYVKGFRKIFSKVYVFVFYPLKTIKIL